MTEIPEHLLKRSKERRAAMSGEDAPSDAPAAGTEVEATDAPASDAPVAAAAAAPPEPVVAPPVPVRPEVAAALARRKIPYWAMPVLIALPLWAYVYQATLEPAPTAPDTPIALGEELYSGCAACHGAGGGGGVGPALTGVRETWPDFRDQMMWVRLGSAGWPTDTYGAQGTPKIGGMPPHAFTDEELAQVVLYERATFGGLEETDPEYLELEEIAEGTKTFEAAGAGPLSQQDGVDPERLKK